jgi:hypothetical protein
MPSQDAAAPETGVLGYAPGEEEREWLDQPSELPRRPRRRLLTPIPLGLMAVLLLACGFFAGVEVQKGQSGSSSTGAAGLSARSAAFAGASGGTARSSGSGFPAAAAGGFPGAGAGGRGAITTGEVSYVRGNTIYVADSQGNTVKVSAAAGSKVTKTVDTKTSAIHPGERVVVLGSQGQNGAISASSITVSSSSSAGTGSSSSGSASGTSSSGAPALFGPG